MEKQCSDFLLISCVRPQTSTHPVGHNSLKKKLKMFSASSKKKQKNTKLKIKAGSKVSYFLDIVPKSKKKIIITALSSVHNSAAALLL